MGWSDAVLDIAERAEQRAAEWGLKDHLHGPLAQEYLLSVARELRTVLKVAVPTVGPEGMLLPYKGNNRNKEEGMEAQFKKQSQREEFSGETMLELAGGPMNGDSVQVPLSMPVGARTSIAGAVYELKEDRRLHFIQSQHN